MGTYRKIGWEDLKIIAYFFSPHKLWVAGFLGFITVSGFLEAFNLAAIYPVMNYGLDLKGQNHFIFSLLARAVEFLSRDNPFLASCIVLLVVSVVAAGSKMMYYFFSHKLMLKIIRENQRNIWDKLSEADYDFYVQNQQGKLIHSSTIAPASASDIVLYTTRLIYDSVQAAFLFCLLLMLSWKGTILLLMAAALYLLFIKGIMEKVTYRCSHLAVEADRRKNVILNEVITGIKSIKIYLAFSSWKRKYADAVDANLINRFKMLIGRACPEVSVKFLFFAMVALVGIFLSQRPAVEFTGLLPVFGTFAIVASRFFPSLQLVGNSLIVIGESAPNTRIVYDICTRDVKKVREGKKVLVDFNDKIAFKDIWFQYQNTHEPLLKGLSFNIEKKKMTAIVGPSGSGKTTIVNLLLKLYEPDRGVIEMDGSDIFEFTNVSYLGQIGYVSQETFIFNSTIRDNICFGMADVTPEMITQAAKLANAHEFIIQTKDGYDTFVGDTGVKLSGGQRQRIAIARAMLRKPRIIIFDEATSSLDNISERRVQEAIHSISQKTTVLVIAHRLSTVQGADKIIILNKGKIQEQGTHEELMVNKDVYYNLYTVKEAAV